MNSINEELKELYKEYSKDIRDNKKYYPYLMHCPEHYEDAKIKIMFVGNDIDNFPKIENVQNVTVEEAIKKNKEKNNENTENPTSKFASSVNKKVNNHPKGFLVTELFMLGDYTGSRMDYKASDKWKEKNYSILKKEVEICKPDCVVFMTCEPSMSDTFQLKGLLGSDIVFMPIRECSDITEIQYKNNELGESISLMIRVPKPKKTHQHTLSKKEEKIIEVSTTLIKKVKRNVHNTKINHA